MATRLLAEPVAIGKQPDQILLLTEIDRVFPQVLVDLLFMHGVQLPDASGGGNKETVIIVDQVIGFAVGEYACCIGI
jgi:hypothetical protein